MAREKRYQVKLLSSGGVKLLGSWKDKAQAFSLYCCYVEEYRGREGAKVVIYDKDEQRYLEVI